MGITVKQSLKITEKKGALVGKKGTATLLWSGRDFVPPIINCSPFLFILINSLGNSLSCSSLASILDGCFKPTRRMITIIFQVPHSMLKCVPAIVFCGWKVTLTFKLCTAQWNLTEILQDGNLELPRSEVSNIQQSAYIICICWRRWTEFFTYIQ